MKDPNPPKPSRPEGDLPSGGSGESQRRILGRAVRHSALPLKGLWLHYFSMGGTAGEYELDAYINASYSLPDLQQDILAQAVNEMIDMLPPPPRASYSDDTDDGGPPTKELQG
ncbi:hypothetical protein LTH96_00035 [Nesterenkonia sp. LB17]|uniref:hypothetical protein n=1 Tax=unclassified Nesterenkonia TaxID=2629769 RepID=UPI001F4C6F6B|nr:MULTISPECIES: hypothetical protein [unclassified Nesterenkonia]MCH8560160.1 hypothetical protein [Nesterenkonia sp. DZ6]MCH8564016.1 hypothetical protein [Nesterenkonia sp. YGD6]MCH8564127.1 hypothetical protein [Nesterenkonia sp. LB17]MCH8569756.1 hypothetical protein [Nesterenkonia sp. AY15]